MFAHLRADSDYRQEWRCVDSESQSVWTLIDRKFSREVLENSKPKAETHTRPTIQTKEGELERCLMSAFNYPFPRYRGGASAVVLKMQNDSIMIIAVAARR